MKVVFWAFGALRRYMPDYQEEIAVEVPEGTAVAGLLSRFSVDAGDVGLIAINGTLTTESALLEPGDRVEIFSPMGGGGPSANDDFFGLKTRYPTAIRDVIAQTTDRDASFMGAPALPVARTTCELL